MKRRLLLLLLWLLLFDRAVPPLLDVAERRHYEGSAPFRFENSDLFALGPLVSYLREHPRHERRRIVFLGNSMLFGYFLTASEAVPAQFEKLQPGTRVYNAAFNGDEIGSSYLIAKDVIDSVDELYVQASGEEANPMLPSLIPVSNADLRRFGLAAPSRAEARLQAWLGRVWQLYRLNDRMQTALFGTSTRLYLYLHKRDIALALLAPVYHPPVVPPVPRPARGVVSLRAPRVPGVVLAATKTQQIRNDLARLAQSRRKRIVFVEFEHGDVRANDADVATFNAAFAPYAECVVITIPPEATFDGMHVYAPGAAQVAEVLARHESEARR
jgi:hypothetical protein